MKKTIGLCMILGNEEDNIQRVLESTLPYVDKCFLTFTQDKDKTREIARKIAGDKLVESEFIWEKHFAKARTFNFAQASTDYILWLDADDTLVGGEKLQKIIADYPQVDGFSFMYNYKRDDEGNLLDYHAKMRLVKNNKKFRWEGRIHEDLLTSAATTKFIDDIVVEHHSGEDRQDDSYKRNLEYLMIDLEEQGNSPDPRTLMYISKSYSEKLVRYKYETQEEFAKDVDTFFNYINRYLKLSGWDEEKAYMAFIASEISRYLGDVGNAIQFAFRSILERPDWSLGRLAYGYALFYKEDYMNAIEWLIQGLKIGAPKTNIPLVTSMFDVEPKLFLAESFMNIGKFERAVDELNKVLSLQPKNEVALGMMELLKDLMLTRNGTRGFIDLTKLLINKKQEFKIKELVNAVSGILASDPAVVGARNKYTVKEDLDVVIYCGESAEAWSPKNVKTGGIGGSEIAVINMAKYWQKEGRNVFVYNWCGENEGVYDGVTYRNYWEINPNDHMNVFIGWRNIAVMDVDWNADKKYIWMHDVPQLDMFVPERVDKVDKIIVLSKYHRSLFPDIPDDKFYVSRNGIDLDRYKDSFLTEKKKGKIVYSSSHNRGLEVIVDNWKKIKKAVPEAKLHVFYGWNTWDAMNKDNPYMMDWKEKMIKKMKQKGIIDHGRVDQNELAKHQKNASVWAYPTAFPEISCITAMEVQAAGAIPVCTDFAALKETVKMGVICGTDIYDEKVLNKWVQDMINTLKGNHDINIEAMIDTAFNTFSWDSVAKEWKEDLFD